MSNESLKQSSAGVNIPRSRMCGPSASLLSRKAIERFWTRVDKSGECWVWTGAKDRRGYGAIRRKDRYLRAHRVSYELVNGPIPLGLIVCHHCDNPPCVNPAHLYAGTDADNVRDMVKRGRINTYNGRQTKLTPDGVRHIRALIAKGGLRLKDIAALMGVSPGAVMDISAGRRWRNVV